MFSQLSVCLSTIGLMAIRSLLGLVMAQLVHPSGMFSCNILVSGEVDQSALIKMLTKHYSSFQFPFVLRLMQNKL